MGEKVGSPVFFLGGVFVVFGFVVSVYMSRVGMGASRRFEVPPVCRSRGLRGLVGVQLTVVVNTGLLGVGPVLL